MGRKSTTGGVTVRGHDRIQFDFKFDGGALSPDVAKDTYGSQPASRTRAPGDCFGGAKVPEARGLHQG
jgi:hypothetical protein